MGDKRTCGDCGPDGKRCELVNEFFVTQGDWHSCDERNSSHDSEVECEPHRREREQRERAEKAEAELGYWRATLESLSANEEPTPAMLTRVLSDLRFRLKNAEAKIAEFIYVESHGESGGD